MVLGGGGGDRYCPALRASFNLQSFLPDDSVAKSVITGKEVFRKDLLQKVAIQLGISKS
jgi:hypothetical protein